MGDTPNRPGWIWEKEADERYLYRAKGTQDVRDYIEHLETESAARMDCIRQLRRQRTELSIQIMELEEQLGEARL